MADNDKTKEIAKTKEDAANAAAAGAGGLEDDDVWGDVEDPLAEVEKMTDE